MLRCSVTFVMLIFKTLLPVGRTMLYFLDVDIKINGTGTICFFVIAHAIFLCIEKKRDCWGTRLNINPITIFPVVIISFFISFNYSDPAPQ